MLDGLFYYKVLTAVICHHSHGPAPTHNCLVKEFADHGSEVVPARIKNGDDM